MHKEKGAMPASASHVDREKVGWWRKRIFPSLSISPEYFCVFVPWWIK
ncbi:MAG: hypothetical protein QGG95_02055 [Nitrospinota bacterium]|nr:hypothetical protein [Nitrospinota bacterium]